MSDNDADKRPRIYGSVAVNGAEIECTVQGAEGESTEDIQPVFEEELAELVGRSHDIEDEPDDKGVA